MKDPKKTLNNLSKDKANTTKVKGGKSVSDLAIGERAVKSAISIETSEFDDKGVHERREEDPRYYNDKFGSPEGSK